MTAEELDAMVRKVDTMVLTAESQPEIYRKLNTLQSNGGGGWRLLRSPVWRDSRIIAVVIRPEKTL